MNRSVRGIRSLFSEISRLDGCELLPHTGMPAILDPQHQIPADLQEFYSLCGGAVLFVGDSNYITIDLASERFGKCYESFCMTHGLVGDSPIIAESFTELLQKLIANQGNYFYWLRDDINSLGDAYD